MEANKNIDPKDDEAVGAKVRSMATIVGELMDDGELDVIREFSSIVSDILLEYRMTETFSNQDLAKTLIEKSRRRLAAF